MTTQPVSAGNVQIQTSGSSWFSYVFISYSPRDLAAFRVDFLGLVCHQLASCLVHVVTGDNYCSELTGIWVRFLVHCERCASKRRI